MFERGRIRLSECCRQLEIFDIAPDPLFAGYQGLRPTSCEMTDYTRALAFAADNLYQALRHGAPLLCSGRDALQTLKLCKSLI